jgi:hypothetical protein
MLYYTKKRFTFAFLIWICFCNHFSAQQSKISEGHGNLALKEKAITQKASVFCPPQGSAKTTKLQELNILKNRSLFPEEKNFDYRISLADLLCRGDDCKRWKSNTAVRIRGYVKDVKHGGIETANCKAKEKNLRDTHIELCLNPMNNEKNNCLIVEITPRIRKIMSEQGEDWSTSMIRSKYLGRWVEVEGWLLFDLEHANMAENTSPGNLRNWRGTAWEVHPMTKIKVTEKR